MSALKKHTPLRWTYQNELTPGGAIFATNWKATLGKFSLVVTNYPGTRTLDWEMTIPGTEWRTGSSVDRYEYTVSTLKDYVYKKAAELNL
jgi:hypothetical protein